MMPFKIIILILLIAILIITLCYFIKKKYKKPEKPEKASSISMMGDNEWILLLKLGSDTEKKNCTTTDNKAIQQKKYTYD